jgi:hypothetical protein
MNVGFGNLATLRSSILPPDLGSDTRFDPFIQALGLGVAGQIENFCNRQFAWAEGDQVEISVEALSYVLPRYPVQTITDVAVRANFTDAWNILNTGDVIAQLRAKSGIVEFWPRWAPPLYFLYPSGGLRFALVRLTCIGGYWWEPLEPTDDGYPSTPPDCAAMLPDDLKFAWLKQCEFLWQQKDKLGVPLEPQANEKVALNPLWQEGLHPAVKQMITQYRRFQIL